MNKIIPILLLLFSSNVDAQWIQQSSGVTGNLRDIEFINKNTGWAVGDGVIIKTTNAGLNWISISHPAIGKPLFGVHPIDSNVVYVCGWFETIIKTTDGGNSWIEIRNGPIGQGHSYNTICFINENTGWITGTGQVVWRTTNGGISLDSTYLFWGTLSDFYFKNSSTGILCGDGIVFKTTNAGLNWFETKIPVKGAFSQFKKIGKYNNQFIWVIGNDARVFRSNDFCDTWVIIDTIETQPPIRGVSFVNENTGYAGGDSGKLYKTTNGGYSWRRENTGTDPRYFGSIFFTNDSTGFICGGAGRLIYTEHGGMTNVNQISSAIPDNFELKQNYPNPFNAQTNIEFSVKEKGYYSLDVFNSLGQKIETTFTGFKTEGTYRINYNANLLSSGVYFYKLSSEKFSITKSFLLIK